MLTTKSRLPYYHFLIIYHWCLMWLIAGNNYLCLAISNRMVCFEGKLLTFLKNAKPGVDDAQHFMHLTVQRSFQETIKWRVISDKKNQAWKRRRILMRKRNHRKIKAAKRKVSDSHVLQVKFSLFLPSRFVIKNKALKLHIFCLPFSHLSSLFVHHRNCTMRSEF